MQPLGPFFCFPFFLHLIWSQNLLMQFSPPAHVKPILAVHKSLQQCLKQAEAHLIVAQRTLGQTGHACVWACRCVFLTTAHRRGQIEGGEGVSHVVQTPNLLQNLTRSRTRQWIQYVWWHTVRATERWYCGKDKTKNKICIPLWRGDKPDHQPD